MSPAPDDELLSAVLDGEATDADVAQVKRDPALAARLEELGAARRAVREPVTPSPDARERAVSAALAAWTPEPAGVAATGVPAGDAPPPPVRPLARAPRRRWLVPAAVAATVVAAVGILAVASRGGRGTTASESATSTTVAHTDTAAGEAGGGTSGGAATTTAGGMVDAAGATTTAGAAAAPGPVRLGALNTPDDVRTALSRLDQAGPDTPSDTTSGRDSAPCPAPAEGAQLAGLAVWQGVPALVFRVSTPPAKGIVVVLSGCQTVLEVPLA